MCCQGDDFILKTVFVVFLASGFLLSGLLNVLKQITSTSTLDEILRFINLAKTEVNYRNAEFSDIYSKALKQNYKYISFRDGEIYANRKLGTKLSEEFICFVRKIGTTDNAGQIALCDEYIVRFEQALNDRKTKEKEKLQVNTALSVFGALTVLIFFL